MKALRSLLLPTILSFIFAASVLTSTAQAGTAGGTVINRTTGKPAPNVELSLIDLQAGMAEVASSKSDAQGQFTFTSDAIGRGPMLIRATFQGVTFNTALPPGRPVAEVEVYDVSKDPKTITVVSHIVIFQPRDGNLLVGEEYIVQNNSQPAQAFFRTEGNFDFAIPPTAKLDQISTTSSTGMAVTQAPIDKGKGHNSIAYAFRPGETNIRLSYQMPYPGNTAKVQLPATYPGVKMLVVAPPGMTVTGDGLSAPGQEQGMMVFSHEPLAAKAVLTVSVSGVGSAPQAADAGTADDQAPPQGGMPQQGNSRTGGEDIQAVPGRLNDFKWIIVLGFAALFGLSAFFLSRKQIIMVPVEGSDEDESAPAASASKKKASAAPAAPAPAKAASPSIATVNAEVNVSLDALKDSIFRLELRRQAGTISEEDYARERAQMEKTLRDLVRG
jgi:pyruvate/2-oxoglutarate dehydrogenase complex dihydrolipoamide acyltransferase (E2) component